MEPLTLSRPLSFCVSPSLLQLQGGYGWTALTSTHRGGFGLYRSVQLFFCRFECVCVYVCVYVSIFSPAEGSMFFFLIPVFTPEVRHVN